MEVGVQQRNVDHVRLRQVAIVQLQVATKIARNVCRVLTPGACRRQRLHLTARGNLHSCLGNLLEHACAYLSKRPQLNQRFNFRVSVQRARTSNSAFTLVRANSTGKPPLRQQPSAKRAWP